VPKFASLRNPINNQLIVKVASRCTHDCKYCHWFRDPEVMKLPKILPLNVEMALLEKIKNHIVKYALETMTVVLHGGEPLLFGTYRFSNFCQGLRCIAQELDVRIPIAVVTNGVLINENRVNFFLEYGVSVAVSIDGPEHINDKNRIYLNG